MLKTMIRIFKGDSGATAIEYGLIAALIGVAIIAGAGAVGNNLNTVLTTISNSIKGPTTTTTTGTGTSTSGGT
jgi:pilus assembly protein Flp/PilA